MTKKFNDLIQRCRICGGMHNVTETEIELEEFYCECCGFRNEVIENE